MTRYLIILICHSYLIYLCRSPYFTLCLYLNLLPCMPPSQFQTPPTSVSPHYLSFTPITLYYVCLSLCVFFYSLLCIFLYSHLCVFLYSLLCIFLYSHLCVFLYSPLCILVYSLLCVFLYSLLCAFLFSLLCVFLYSILCVFYFSLSIPLPLSLSLISSSLSGAISPSAFKFKYVHPASVFGCAWSHHVR